MRILKSRKSSLSKLETTGGLYIEGSNFHPASE